MRVDIGCSRRPISEFIEARDRGQGDVDAAAEYLARPKSRIYDLVAQGRLRHFRDGRSLLFRAEDLDACLGEREASA